jgi:DNA-binding SARP family transcriptional activator
MAASVRLLGTPAVKHGEGWLEPPIGKLFAILYYLACQEGWVNRDDLLYLFWPDTPEQSARQNLRPLLTKLRRFPYAQDLEIEASRLRWPVESDIHAFKQALAERRWAQAVQRYGGELLKGFTLEGAPEFTSWLELERAKLHHAWGEATLNLADELEGTKRYADSAQVLERLYKADSLDETILKRYLRALHLSGERHKALAAFASFKEMLQEELEVEPEADTLRLVERIKSGESLDEGTAKVTTARERRPKVKMPVQATPFIGREIEKVKLAAKLDDPACHLTHHRRSWRHRQDPSRHRGSQREAESLS